MYRNRMPDPPPPAPQPPPQQPRRHPTVTMKELLHGAIDDLELTEEQALILCQHAKDYNSDKMTRKEFIRECVNVVGRRNLSAVMKRIIKTKEAQAASTRKWSFLPNKAPDEKTPSECKVCLSRPSEVVFTGCGHVCICLDCADQLPSMKPNAHAKCVLCNQESKVQTCYFTK